MGKACDWRDPWSLPPPSNSILRKTTTGNGNSQYLVSPTRQSGLPCSSVSKESACSAGDLGWIPGLGRSPGEGNGNLLQYPWLENLMDRGAWWAAVHGVTKSWARLSN